MKRTVIERLDVGARLLAATPLSKTRPPQLHRHARSGSRLFCTSFMQQAVVAQQLQHDVRASIYTNAHGLVSSLESLASLMETDLGGMDSWVRRLDLAAAALQKGQRQRIAIIGDDLARPQDVVTALLQDPLIADSEYRTSLYDRHVGVVEEQLVISVSDAVERLPNALRLPSSWLYETGCDLLEVTSDTQEFSSDAIMVSDIILLVLDPYRLVTPQAQRLLDVLGGDDRLHVVVNGPASVLAKTQVESRLAQQAPSCCSLHYVDATAAQDAVTIFQASQSSASSIQPSAVEQFQSKFLNSRMNVLQAAIAQQAKSTPDYATRTPAILVQLALRQVRTTIGEERVSSQKAVDAVRSLEQAVQRKTSTIRHRSVAWRGIESGLVEGGVDHMMSGLRHQISAQFDTRWNWLNLVGKGRVDEVGREIRHHISAEFGRALDRQLIFESGKLAQIQEGISSDVDKTLRQFSGLQPANTAVLSNHLASLSVSIPTITPDCLTGPIEARRHQLLDTSASRLHRSAQRALGGTVSLSALSAALSWASTLPSIELLSVDTAVGLAGLGIVGSFALGQRAWLKAQRRFWRDWDRVISMLRGDLQTTFSNTVETHLTAKPRAAAQGLQQIIEKRRQRLAGLERELDNIQTTDA